MVNNGKREEKVILLMIADSKKWQYLAVKIYRDYSEEYHQII